ncbi:MAG: hypothetical protein ACP5PV_04460 [Methanothrix sp.]
MEKLSVLVISLIILFHSTSQMAIAGQSVSLCNLLIKANITKNFSEDIKFGLPECNHQIIYTGYGNSKKIKSILKIRELGANDAVEWNQGIYTLIDQETKGFTQLERNNTYEIGNNKGILFFHGWKRNVAEEIEQHVYLIQYNKSIIERRITVIVKCYCEPFKDSNDITVFFKEIYTNFDNLEKKKTK